MKPKTNILICEPSDMILEGLKSLISSQQRFHVMDTLHSATNLRERLTVLRPDILIVNPTIIDSPPVGVATIALVYQYVEPERLKLYRHTLDIRANRSSLIALLDTCEHVAEPDPQESYELSEREVEVLVLVAKGYASKEIADQLNISIHTVNSHRKNITHKTGIKSPAGLAVYAMLHGLA